MCENTTEKNYSKSDFDIKLIEIRIGEMDNERTIRFQSSIYK